MDWNALCQRGVCKGLNCQNIQDVIIESGDEYDDKIEWNLKSNYVTKGSCLKLDSNFYKQFFMKIQRCLWEVLEKWHFKNQYSDIK